MRRPAAFALFVVIAASSAIASSLPLTGKEISLMLRSGYSSDAIMHELATRHFGDVFDAAMETELLKAGASQVLVDGLRTGTYQSSGQEMEAAKQRISAQENARATAQEKATENPQSASRSNTATTAAYQQAGGTITDHLKGDLVYWHNGALTPFDDSVLEKKKYYLLFFSAFWSKPGREVAAQLRDYYNRVAPQHPEFEVIFYSFDRSSFAMENYISQSEMPWPAVDYNKRDGKAGAMPSKLVSQVPHIILAETAGKILSDSGENPANLDKVLGDLDKLLAAEK